MTKKVIILSMMVADVIPLDCYSISIPSLQIVDENIIIIGDQHVPNRRPYVFPIWILSIKNKTISIFKYMCNVYTFRCVSDDQACRFWLLRYLGLRWVFDDDNIFVNSPITFNCYYPIVSRQLFLQKVP